MENEIKTKKSKKKSIAIIIAIVAVVALAITLTVVLTQCGKEKYEYENAEKYKLGDFNQTIEVSAIDVEWIGGTVEIINGVGSGVSCYEYSEMPLADDYTMRTWFDGSVLRIRPAASGERLDKIPVKNLTITIPQGYYFNDIDIITYSAGVEISQVGALFASVESNEGNITFAHIGASTDVKLKSNSGNISYTHSVGVVQSFAASTVSGSITAEDTSVAKSFVATSDSGAVSLTLPESAGFTLTLEGAFVSYGGFTGGSDNGKLVVGDGSSSVTLKSASGEVVLKKRK